MQLIFDHILATVIGVTIILALLSTHFRVQQSGIEQVSAHAAKTKAISLSKWLERDITGLGANFGNNLSRFEAPVFDENGNTVEWMFYSDSLQESGSTVRHLTRYILTEVGEIEQQGQLRPLYQIEREIASSPVIDGQMEPLTPSAWQASGQSVATLSSFRIGLVARDGVPAIGVDTADYIRVSFAMVPEFERHRGYLHELYWSTLLKVRPFWQPPQST